MSSRGCVGTSAPREVGRRAYNGEPKVPGHGTAIMSLSITSPSWMPASKPSRHDVHRRVAHDEVELDVRVLREEPGEEWLADQRLRGARCVDAERAARLVAQLAYRGHGGAHLVQRRPHQGVEPLASLRQVHAARGAPNEGHAEPLLEPPQRLAHGRVAYPEALARRAKSLRLRYRDEGRDPVEFIGHWAEY